MPSKIYSVISLTKPTEVNLINCVICTDSIFVSQRYTSTYGTLDWLFLSTLLTYQICDSFRYQIESSLQSSSSFTEIGASCRSDNSTASMNDTRHWWPICFFNILTAVDHSLISFAYEVHLEVKINFQSKLLVNRVMSQFNEMRYLKKLCEMNDRWHCKQFVSLSTTIMRMYVPCIRDKFPYEPQLGQLHSCLGNRHHS